MITGKELIREAGAELTPEEEAGKAPIDTRPMVAALKKDEIQGLARYLVEDPIYLENIQRRLRDGRLPPPIEIMLFNYAYGKPKERVEHTHAAIVKIIHELAEVPKPVVGTVVDAEVTSE